MRSPIMTFLFSIFLLLGTAGAQAERVALVVGKAGAELDASFGSALTLTTHNLADKLRSLGFKVDEAVNQPASQTTRSLDAFVSSADNAELALLYFVGTADLESEALAEAIRKVGQRAPAVVVVDDKVGSRRLDQLSKLGRPNRVLVAYSSAEADQVDAPALYLGQSLLRQLERETVRPVQLASLLHDDMVTSTYGEHAPFIIGSLPELEELRHSVKRDLTSAEIRRLVRDAHFAKSDKVARIDRRLKELQCHVGEEGKTEPADRLELAAAAFHEAEPSAGSVRVTSKEADWRSLESAFFGDWDRSLRSASYCPFFQADPGTATAAIPIPRKSGVDKDYSRRPKSSAPSKARPKSRPSKTRRARLPDTSKPARKYKKPKASTKRTKTKPKRKPKIKKARRRSTSKPKKRRVTRSAPKKRRARAASRPPTPSIGVGAGGFF